MSDFSRDASRTPEGRLPEADDLVLGDDVDGLDAAWSWDEPASPIPPEPPSPEKSAASGASMPPQQAARGQAEGNARRSIGTPASPSPTREALESHRLQITRLLEDGQRYRAMHALLNATSMGCIDRALLFKLCALARELSLEVESAEAMTLAFGEDASTEGILLCLLATRLFCKERQFARAQALLDEARARWPDDERLACRSIFAALRAGDDERAIASLRQRIERARTSGDRRAAARFNQWLGRLFDARLSDRFRAAECHARAAALYKALALPRETFRAQRAALVCLSRIDPRPRQLDGAVLALRATARTAGCQAAAEEIIDALGLTAPGGGAEAAPLPPSAVAQEEAGEVAPPSDGAASPEEIFQRAIESSAPLAEQELPVDEQQTKPLRREAFASHPGAAVADAVEAGQSPEGSPAAASATAPTEGPAGGGRFLSYFLEAEQEKLTRTERRGLEQRVLSAPFDAEAYRALAAYYGRHGRADHARLIMDVADALDGRAKDRPMPPLTLSDGDWRALQHPALDAIAHELGLLIGAAVFQVNAAPLDTFQPRGAFSMDGSDGAWALADALLCAVRVLGVRVDDVQLCKSGPLPVFPVCSAPPALIVSKSLLKKQLPSAVLRFFAGRALASLRPELSMFLLVPQREVEAALTGIRKALNREGRMSERTRAVVQKVSGKSADRLGWILERLSGQGEGVLARQREGARHTVNRMGLLTAGGIAPALEALDFEGAGEVDRIELLRFAISKAYREFRLRAA